MVIAEPFSNPGSADRLIKDKIPPIISATAKYSDRLIS